MSHHKVERVIDEYSLSGTGDELEARWTNELSERASLRDLADYLNQQILRAALNDAGVDVFDDEVETFYRQLTDDDVLRATKNELRRRFEEDGVLIDDIESDFVSHQSIYTYLTEIRDANLKEVEDSDQVAEVNDQVQRLRGRLEAVTRREFTTLSNTDRLTLGEFEVLS